MCGRYTLGVEADEVVETFDVPPPTFPWRTRYNIAPTHEAPVVAEDERGRRIGLMRFGLVPAWADDPARHFINARAESVAAKPAFRSAFRSRRCLVPADGFYEWRREGAQAGGKQPYWFHPASGGLLSFAGIWERWARSGREPWYGFAILTTDAGPDVRDVHERMPVIVPPERRADWLAADDPVALLRSLMEPPPAGFLARHPVARRVNRPDEDDPGLIEPVDAE